MRHAPSPPATRPRPCSSTTPSSPPAATVTPQIREDLRRMGVAHRRRHHQSGRRACGVPLQGGALQRQRDQGQADPDRHGHSPSPRQQHPAHGRDLGAAMIDEKTTYLKLPAAAPGQPPRGRRAAAARDLAGPRRQRQNAGRRPQGAVRRPAGRGRGAAATEAGPAGPARGGRRVGILPLRAHAQAPSPRATAAPRSAAYTVGNKRLRVYLCGLRCEAGADAACYTSIRKWGQPGQPRPSSAGTTRSPRTTISLWR